MQLLLFTEHERSFLDQDPEHEHVDDGSSCPGGFFMFLSLSGLRIVSILQLLN